MVVELRVNILINYITLDTSKPIKSIDNTKLLLEEAYITFPLEDKATKYKVHLELMDSVRLIKQYNKNMIFHYCILLYLHSL